jgi:hypothetical protein
MNATGELMFGLSVERLFLLGLVGVFVLGSVLPVDAITSDPSLRATLP